jgi:hypothetical protein
MSLPSNAAARKAVPIFSGVLRYFPDALAAVAECSRAGNEQHNPGKPLHWDRSKSTDEADALARHLIDVGEIDSDGIRHSAKVAWRALALLQKEIETANEVHEPWPFDDLKDPPWVPPLNTPVEVSHIRFPVGKHYRVGDTISIEEIEDRDFRSMFLGERWLYCKVAGDIGRHVLIRVVPLA